MDFDAPRPRFGSGSTKWDGLKAFQPGAGNDTLPMWVAQMDFASPACVIEAARTAANRDEWGYFPHASQLFEATATWLRDRHGWSADPGRMFATHGLGNGIGILLQALTEPGDGVIVFSPVYHEFAAKVARNGRALLEAPLAIGPDGRFALDLPALESRLTGRERMILLSAPHNPAGRIWTAEEFAAIGALCERHDLVLVSDEIHMDLVYPGHRHLPAALALPDLSDRLVIATAASKTFDLAGLRVGVVAIPGDRLAKPFAKLHRALDIQPNRLGVELSVAALSAEGAAWVDALMTYLDGNRRLFCDGVNAIPGLAAMPMDATFLAWVDFTDTGLDQAEIDRRVREVARIAPSPGLALGLGGALHHRFNIGTQRAVVAEAVERLADAFA